jgi:hypothetical protein
MAYTDKRAMKIWWDLKYSNFVKAVNSVNVMILLCERSGYLPEIKERRDCKIV